MASAGVLTNADCSPTTYEAVRSDTRMGRWVQTLVDAANSWSGTGSGTPEFSGSLSAVDFGGTGTRDYLLSRPGSFNTQYFPTVQLKRDAQRFADFDRDGRTDGFKTENDRWYVSPGATGAWDRINGSTAHVRVLRFADLDGDDRTYIFRTTSTQWYVSYAGRSAWVALKRASGDISRFYSADVNGDGADEILKDIHFNAVDGTHRATVSMNRTRPWVRMHIDCGTVDFVDFDGDGYTDPDFCYEVF